MWDFLGGALGGLLGYKGAKDQNIASAEQAEKAMAFSKESQEKQMRFQERMSGSAHQRQMADMRKAGLNPILSAKYGGASSPAGSSAAGVAAPQFNKAEQALKYASTAQNLKNMLAQEDLIESQANAAQQSAQVSLNQFYSTLGEAQIGRIANSMYQTPAGKKMIQAALIANSAKSVTSAVGQLIPFSGGKPK